MSSHMLIKGKSGSRVSGVLEMKIQPFRSRAQPTALHSAEVSSSDGRSFSASETRFNVDRTALLCGAAVLSISGAKAVPASRVSISSGLLIHSMSCLAEGRNVSKYANIFRELSVKNRFSSSLSGQTLFAIVSASLGWLSSLDGFL